MTETEAPEFIYVGAHVATFNETTDEQIDCEVLEVYKYGAETWVLLQDRAGNQFEIDSENVWEL